MRIGTKLKYEIERNPCDSDTLLIKSGTVILRVYRRKMKYDGWNGFEAYSDERSGVYNPMIRASKWFPLLRKIEKLEGTLVKSVEKCGSCGEIKEVLPHVGAWDVIERICEDCERIDY